MTEAEREYHKGANEREFLARLADRVGAVYPTDDTPAGSLDDLGLKPFSAVIRGLLVDPPRDA